MTYTNVSTSAYERPYPHPVRQSEYLVDAAQSGSSAAFSELHALYERRIYRTILAITQNTQDAEDASQDAFLRAYLAIKRFERRANFYSWLTRIAINSALVVLRKRRIRPELCVELPHEAHEEGTLMEFKDMSPSPEQRYLHKQQYNLIMKAVQRLEPRLRSVVEEQLSHDGSIREIASTLNISEAAVKSRLYRARGRLGKARAIKCLST